MPDQERLDERSRIGTAKRLRELAASVTMTGNTVPMTAAELRYVASVLEALSASPPPSSEERLPNDEREAWRTESQYHADAHARLREALERIAVGHPRNPYDPNPYEAQTLSAIARAALESTSGPASSGGEGR